MTIDSRRIESIVGEVLQRLEATGRGSDSPGMAPLGIHRDLDSAVAGARASFEAFDQVPLSVRAAAIAAIRETLAANYQVLAELAVSETGLGRVEDRKSVV